MNTPEGTPNHTHGEKCPCCCGEKSKQPAYHAYEILHFAFAIIPIIAGLDKFFNYLTVWEKYLSTPFDVFANPHTTMLVVGVIEIIAGIGVWLKPKIFAYIIAIWMLLMIINLFLLGNYYDIAARDFGLMLGALALGRLSMKYDCNLERSCKQKLNEKNLGIK